MCLKAGASLMSAEDDRAAMSHIKTLRVLRKLYAPFDDSFQQINSSSDLIFAISLTKLIVNIILILLRILFEYHGF